MARCCEMPKMCHFNSIQYIKIIMRKQKTKNRHDVQWWVLLLGLCRLWIKETKYLPNTNIKMLNLLNYWKQAFVLKLKWNLHLQMTFSHGGKKIGSLSYYCRLSMALSLNTLGRSLSQSRDTLMAGRGHSPMISSRFLLSKARLSITPKKDTRERQLNCNTEKNYCLWGKCYRFYMDDQYFIYFFYTLQNEIVI